jgi:hypothetical protein
LIWIAKRSPSGVAGGLDVLEADRLARVLGADRSAEEAVLVKDADLGHVPRVVADRGPLADIVGECRGLVAEGLEADPVAVNDTAPGDHHQQQIELLERLERARQPTRGEPCLLRRDAGLAVLALVVDLDDPAADRVVDEVVRDLVEI